MVHKALSILPSLMGPPPAAPSCHSGSLAVLPCHLRALPPDTCHLPLTSCRCLRRAFPGHLVSPTSLPTFPSWPITTKHLMLVFLTAVGAPSGLGILSSVLFPALSQAWTQQALGTRWLNTRRGPAAQQCPLERAQASPPSFLIPHARPAFLVGFMAAMVPSLRAPMV